MLEIDDELAVEEVGKDHDTKLNYDIIDRDHHNCKYNPLKNKYESVALRSQLI